MTFLVGQQGSGWTPLGSTIVQTAGNAGYLAAGYTAAASGTMTTVHLQVVTTSTATAAKVSIYAGTSAGSSLVATSGVIDLTGTGDRTASISGSITSGQLYAIVLQCSSGSCNFEANTGASAFVDRQNTAANFSYASPPSTLPTADVTATGREFLVWIDGTVSGGSMQNFNGAACMMGAGT